MLSDSSPIQRRNCSQPAAVAYSAAGTTLQPLSAASATTPREVGAGFCAPAETSKKISDRLSGLSPEDLHVPQHTDAAGNQARRSSSVSYRLRHRSVEWRFCAAVASPREGRRRKSARGRESEKKKRTDRRKKKVGKTSPCS